MDQQERRRIYAALSAPFPEEAIERTDGRATGKGYSTTGIKYQYVVNRLNEVLGVGGFRVERKVTVKEMTTAKGRPAFDVTCEVRLQLGEWAEGKFVPFAEALGDGGHTALSMADAIKGAYTNGFKKTAAFLGVGRQAYEGTLDDDNLPADEGCAAPAVPPGNGTPRAAAASTAPRQQAAPVRNRLTAKQLSAIWATARDRGFDEQTFRGQVRQRYRVQPEYLTREQAADLIAALGANGRDRHAGEA